MADFEFFFPIMIARPIQDFQVHSFICISPKFHSSGGSKFFIKLIICSRNISTITLKASITKLLDFFCDLWTVIMKVILVVTVLDATLVAQYNTEPEA